MEAKMAAGKNQPANTFSAVLLLSFCIIIISQADATLLDPSLMGRELQMFARDALGVDEMQNYFDGFQYHKLTIKGEEVTPHLAVKLSDKFKARFEVTKRLKKAVEDSYARSEKALPETECCHVNKSTLKYSERFRCKVDLNNVCMKISGSASSNPVYLDERVFQEMKDILETYPFIKWQYFGSEEGVMTIYPLFDDHEECGKFDPRYRPYYVETATPEAKDVVLVIDISASMSGEKLYIAKEAAKTVLDTMNPRDQVGVVSFNNHASTPGDVGSKSRCYSQRLALAIPANIRCMKNYVDGLVPYGQTQYRIGFEKAFSLLKGSVSEESGEKKKRVILFLTDGAPSDEKTELIFETIRDRNVELNNSVIILTYGFGNADQAILEDIAKQNTAKYGVTANTSVGDIAPGRYTFLEDIKTLRSVMATYYNLFALGKQLSPVVSVPYIDAFGTGLMITITLPCFHKGNFIGVVGTDIHVEDLLSDITFFNQGQSTYAFVVSNSGRTLIHPLLPIPTDAYGDPFFIDIRTLETETEFNEIFDSIKNGRSGSKTFVAKRFLPRGEKEKDGVMVIELNCTYVWAPLAEIDFSVGVVVPVSHAKDQLNSLSIPPDYTFKYHRLDLNPPEKPCSHFGTFAAKDTTVVTFAPGAYLDPFEFLGKKDTKADVDLLTAYMKDKTGTVTNPGLKSDIRDTVIATWKVEDLWLRDKTELARYLVWRYIGTSNGVFRSTPGSVADKGYDPRQRPWYRTALAHTGLLALTSPYVDSGGAGVVITAGRALYRGEPSHMHHTNDEVLGVMGADFPLTYFHRLLTKVYPMCKWTKTYSCFVMDSAGFLIMHEDFLLSSTAASDAEYVHITEKEKYIAEDLIKKRYLVKRECRDLEEIRKKSFYEVHLPPGGADTLRSGARCTKYQLAQIIGTNAYIGVAVRELLCSPEPCACSLDTKCSFFNLTCECPCTSSMEFRYCLNQFPDSSIPICPPSTPERETKTDHHSSPVPKMKCKDRGPTPGLAKCFDPRCRERNSSQTCEGVVGCYWCENDKDNVPLKQPYCASSEVCFRGREAEQLKCPMEGPNTTFHPLKDESTNDKVNTVQEDSGHGTSTGALAGIAFGCTALLAVIVITTFLVTRHCRGPPTSNIESTSSLHIIIDESITDPETRPPEPLPGLDNTGCDGHYDEPDSSPPQPSIAPIASVQGSSDPVTRPPEPLPVLDNTECDGHYDEPDSSPPQSSIAPIASVQGPSAYDNEMIVRSGEKPPDVPPPRKESAAAASAIPQTTSLRASLLEEKVEYSGSPLEFQNIRASDIRPPDNREKKRKSSHVIPAPPRRHSEDNRNATTPLKNKLARTPSLPTSELRSPFDTNMLQSAAGESQQCGFSRPVLLHRESSDSVVLDMDGYVKCIP